MFQHPSSHLVEVEESSGDGFVTLAPDSALQGWGCVLENNEFLIPHVAGWSEAAVPLMVTSVVLGRHPWRCSKSLLLLQHSLFTF